MILTFFGTGGAGAPPHRMGMCIGVETKSARILLDVGEGCSRTLRALGYRLRDFDAIVITHAHPDHCAGIFDLFVSAMAENALPDCIAIVLLQQTLVDSRVALELLPRSVRERIIIKYLDNGKVFRYGDITVTPVEAYHTVPAVSLVVSDKETKIFYTGDTWLNEEILNAMKGCSTVITEVALPSSESAKAKNLGHISADMVPQIRASIDPDALLVLTHVTARSEPEVVKLSKELKKTIVPADGTVVYV